MLCHWGCRPSSRSSYGKYNTAQSSIIAWALHRSMVGRTCQDPGLGDLYTGAMGGQSGDMEGKGLAQMERHRTEGEFASGSTWEAEEGK